MMITAGGGYIVGTNGWKQDAIVLKALPTAQFSLRRRKLAARITSTGVSKDSGTAPMNRIMSSAAVQSRSGCGLNAGDDAMDNISTSAFASKNRGIIRVQPFSINL